MSAQKNRMFDGHLKLFPTFWVIILDSKIRNMGLKLDGLLKACKRQFLGLFKCTNVCKPELLTVPRNKQPWAQISNTLSPLTKCLPMGWKAMRAKRSSWPTSIRKSLPAIAFEIHPAVVRSTCLWSPLLASIGRSLPAIAFEIHPAVVRSTCVWSPLLASIGRSLPAIAFEIHPAVVRSTCVWSPLLASIGRSLPAITFVTAAALRSACARYGVCEHKLTACVRVARTKDNYCCDKIMSAQLTVRKVCPSLKLRLRV